MKTIKVSIVSTVLAMYVSDTHCVFGVCINFLLEILSLTYHLNSVWNLKWSQKIVFNELQYLMYDHEFLFIEGFIINDLHCWFFLMT